MTRPKALETKLPPTFKVEPKGTAVFVVRFPVTVAGPPIEVVPELVTKFPLTVKFPAPEKLPPFTVKLVGRLKDEPELFTKVPPFMVKLDALKTPPL